MNKLQLDKLGMFHKIKTLCNELPQIWESDIPFNKAFHLFNQNISSIEKIKKEQVFKTNTVTKEKNEKRLALEAKAVFVVKRLCSFAKANNNDLLFEEINFTPRRFRKAKDKEILNFLNIIIEKAGSYQNDLMAYGLTQTVLNQLKNSMSEFDNIINAPIKLRGEINDATHNIRKLFKETDTILKHRLDNDVIVFQEDNKEFVERYFASRKIVSSNSSILSLKGQISEANTGEALGGVEITIARSTIHKKSSPKGNYRINNIPEGERRVTFSLEGYLSQIHTIHFTEGETIVLDILLEKK